MTAFDDLVDELKERLFGEQANVDAAKNHRAWTLAAARAARKRLRRQRDAARVMGDAAIATVAARGHVIDALTQERDSARRDLAALEWLVKPLPASVRGTWGWDPRAGCEPLWTDTSGGRRYHSTYADAARVLGWEG
jgi:hypothetical protein